MSMQEITPEYIEQLENNRDDWRERTEEEVSEKCEEYKKELNERDELTAEQKSVQYFRYLEWMYGGVVEEEVSGIVEDAERVGFDGWGERERFTTNAKKYWIDHITEKIDAYRQELESEAVYV